ncbi:MAG: hypothetical protein ACOY2B_07215 [Pseudomonadota bacterium]
MNEDAPNPEKPGIAFDYIKSNFFRVIRADGAIGGPTANGQLHIVFYSERAAIPRRVIHELKDDNTLGAVREIQSRESMVRELDVDLFLSCEVARSLHLWLGEQIEKMKELNDNTK